MNRVISHLISAFFPTKKFQDENCIYAGVPANKIKEKISWVRENASILKRRNKQNEQI